MSKKSGAKGLAAEEALRCYFLSTGYFVVRSVPFDYKSYNVTDVDLWLYIRATSLARERACVDVKRKRTPQAMERVFWTKGLREALGIERAIVVTTDNRSETRDFGTANGVIVLHGDFLQRVINGFAPVDRITEEEFLTLLDAPCVINSAVQWRRWYHNLKAKLIDGLDFDSCNAYLLAIKLLLDEYLVTGKSAIIPVRLLYATISYLLVCIDYASRSVAHLDIGERKSCLTDGFRYGEAGRRRTEEIVDMALLLLEDSGKTNLLSQPELRSEFERQSGDYPAEILAEHFAKLESLKYLFELARGFERQAYSRLLVLPDQCPSEQKAVIGLLCDFLRQDRRAII